LTCHFRRDEGKRAGRESHSVLKIGTRNGHGQEKSRASRQTYIRAFDELPIRAEERESSFVKRGRDVGPGRPLANSG
jgi:hypothetical protein